MTYADALRTYEDWDAQVRRFAQYDEVILGCVNAHPDEVNPGRIAGLRLGLGTAVPGWTVRLSI